jgi:hypothetical protein
MISWTQVGTLGERYNPNRLDKPVEHGANGLLTHLQFIGKVSGLRKFAIARYTRLTESEDAFSLASCSQGAKMALP